MCLCSPFLTLSLQHPLRTPIDGLLQYDTVQSSSRPGWTSSSLSSTLIITPANICILKFFMRSGHVRAPRIILWIPLFGMRLTTICFKVNRPLFGCHSNVISCFFSLMWRISFGETFPMENPPQTMLLNLTKSLIGFVELSHFISQKTGVYGTWRLRFGWNHITCLISIPIRSQSSGIRSILQFKSWRFYANETKPEL